MTNDRRKADRLAANYIAAALTVIIKHRRSGAANHRRWRGIAMRRRRRGRRGRHRPTVDSRRAWRVDTIGAARFSDTQHLPRRRGVLFWRRCCAYLKARANDAVALTRPLRALAASQELGGLRVAAGTSGGVFQRRRHRLPAARHRLPATRRRRPSSSTMRRRRAQRRRQPRRRARRRRPRNEALPS